MRALLFFTSFAVALAVSAVIMPAVIRRCHRKGAVDRPGGRRIHVGEIPRLGGIGIFLGFVAGTGAALLALAAPALAAHRLELIDGTFLDGRIVARSEEAVIVRIGDAEYAVPRAVVARIRELPPGSRDPRDPRDPPIPRQAPDRILLHDGGILVGQIVRETTADITVWA